MKILKSIYVTIFLIYILLLFYLFLGTFDNDSFEDVFNFLGIPLNKLIYILNRLPGEIQFDKMIHFSLFVPLPTIFWAAFGKEVKSIFSKNRIVIIFIISIIIGGITELSQFLNPLRSISIYDFFANLIGVSFGILLLIVLLNIPIINKIITLGNE